MAQHRISSLTSQVVQADALLDDPRENRRFIDVRLGEPADELRSFRDAHIHGAVHAQIRDVFADTPTAQTGSLPLPRTDALQHQLHEWGVDPETELVLYGPSLALAARGWWVLRWAGLRNVRVLDGGLKAWAALGGPLAQGDTRPAPAASQEALVLTPGHMPQISVEEVEQLGPGEVLIDARDENAYRAGCIPGAVNLPSAEQWTPGSSLRTVGELRSLYERAGALSGKPVVAYCGGGVLSALTVLTLSSLGVMPRLFVGSWSQWSTSAERMARSVNEKATT